MANLKTREELSLSNAPDFHHKLVESFKFAYAKRSLLGDPNFQKSQRIFDELVSNLTNFDYAGTFASKISNMTYDYTYYEPSFELINDSGTSHLNVIDEKGMAVSITSTINQYFGSKIIGKRTGIILNNEMDDFSTPGLINGFGLPPSEPNFIAPGKRPMSSMTPVIVTDKRTGEVNFFTLLEILILKLRYVR